MPLLNHPATKPTPQQLGQDADARWIELAACHEGRWIRHHYVHEGDTAAMENWRTRFGNQSVYCSIATFAKPDAKSSYVSDWFLDVDAEDLEAARNDALGICDHLIRKWQIEVEWLGVWFSGAKGFHIQIPRVVFGDPTGSHVLPIYRHLARRLHHMGFDHVDGSIYQPNRVLRLANSIHATTQLHKYPLEYAELADLNTKEICQLARKPRGEDSMALPASEAPRALAWWRSACDWYRDRRDRRQTRAGLLKPTHWQYPPCIRAIESATLSDGCRHNVYFTLARFYAFIGMAPPEIAYRLNTINDRNPIGDPDYIKRLANDARNYDGFKGCPNEYVESFCEPAQCFLTSKTSSHCHVTGDKPATKTSSQCTTITTNDVQVVSGGTGPGPGGPIVNVVLCQRCGTPVNDAEFCPRCGARQCLSCTQ